MVEEEFFVIGTIEITLDASETTWKRKKSSNYYSFCYKGQKMSVVSPVWLIRFFMITFMCQPVALLFECSSAVFTLEAAFL